MNDGAETVSASRPFRGIPEFAEVLLEAEALLPVTVERLYCPSRGGAQSRIKGLDGTNEDVGINCDHRYQFSRHIAPRLLQVEPGRYRKARRAPGPSSRLRELSNQRRPSPGLLTSRSNGVCGASGCWRGSPTGPLPPGRRAAPQTSPRLSLTIPFLIITIWLCNRMVIHELRIRV